MAQVRAGWIYHHGTGMGRRMWWCRVRPGAFCERPRERDGFEAGTGAIRSSVDVRDRWFDRQRCLRGDAGQMALRRVRRMSRRSHVWLHVSADAIQRNNQQSFFFPPQGDYLFVVFQLENKIFYINVQQHRTGNWGHSLKDCGLRTEGHSIKT